MATQRRHRPPLRDLLELGPPVEERMALDPASDVRIVGSYVLTRGAERAWREINLRSGADGGAVFWIGGPPASGKTHFLNYCLALERKAPAQAGENARRVTLALNLATGGEDLEAQLLDAMAHELCGSHRETTLWQQMRGPEALTVALDQARRLGIGAITVVIDLGAAESEAAAAYLASIAQICPSVKHLNFTVIAAGRGRAPCGTLAFDVAPADACELIAAAIGRARRLRETDTMFDDFYDGIDVGRLDPRAIFPFHPLAIEAIRALANSANAVPEMARLAREVLTANGASRGLAHARLIVPADLAASPTLRALIEERLGGAGRAALKLARAVVERLRAEERELAGAIVETLALAHLGRGPATLSVEKLAARLPAEDSGGNSAQIGGLLRTLAELSQGVIRAESGLAQFQLQAAGAPEVAAFNAALPLIQRFDPTITAAEELPELKAKLKRLEDAMADALEAANRTREALAPLLTHPSSEGALPERSAAVADFIALAARGPEGLIEVAADAARRDTMLATLAAYDELAKAAAAVPRLRAMNDYLQATGLKWGCDDDSARDPKVAALESQCQLLASQMNPEAALGEAHKLEALRARFQQFRWSYVQEYRAAHARWQAEMKRLTAVASDARRHLEALARLNSVAGLGPVPHDGFAAQMEEIERRVAPCEYEGALAPEVNPRCPQCGFVLGTPSPATELDDLFGKIRAAIAAKFTALSKSAIARLIREHDHDHRLDGFLKITQAAQTDALVRVLDDKLAQYLDRLIRENLVQEEAGGAEAESLAHRPTRRTESPHPRRSAR